MPKTLEQPSDVTHGATLTLTALFSKFGPGTWCNHTFPDCFFHWYSRVTSYMVAPAQVAIGRAVKHTYQDNVCKCCDL